MNLNKFILCKRMVVHNYVVVYNHTWKGRTDLFLAVEFPILRYLELHAQQTTTIVWNTLCCVHFLGQLCSFHNIRISMWVVTSQSYQYNQQISLV